MPCKHTSLVGSKTCSISSDAFPTGFRRTYFGHRPPAACAPPARALALAPPASANPHEIDFEPFQDAVQSVKFSPQHAPLQAGRRLRRLQQVLVGVHVMLIKFTLMCLTLHRQMYQSFLPAACAPPGQSALLAAAASCRRCTLPDETDVLYVLLASINFLPAAHAPPGRVSAPTAPAAP